MIKNCKLLEAELFQIPCVAFENKLWYLSTLSREFKFIVELYFVVMLNPNVFANRFAITMLDINEGIDS